MLIKEFSRPVTSAQLNESLAKRFGTKIDLSKFTVEQLEDARNRLRTQLSQVETNESYESVMQSDGYQKSKMFLDVINAAIAEAEKMDPVGQEDDDVNNDGKTDSSDEYLKKRRAAIAKSTKKKKVSEGAEEEATLVMASKDMVDRITGWMEDTAEMQTESMLELGDKIRDELGIDKSEEFIGTVKPALDSLFTALESTRDSLTSGVAVLTGEGAPQTMGDEVPADDDDEMDMEPTVDADAEAEAPEGEDEFATADASVGGEEPADREKRESLELSKRLGLLLADSKKKV